MPDHPRMSQGDASSSLSTQDRELLASGEQAHARNSGTEASFLVSGPLAEVPAASSAASPAAACAEPHYPDWLSEHVNTHRSFIEELDPFPFDHPSDISPYLSLHQNDYLRLSNHPSVVRARTAANRKKRIESFSSSVFGGASREHEDLLALFRKSLEAGDVLLTTAGWTANVGVVEAIAKPDLPIYIDSEAHASLFDGIRLAAARRMVLRHNDPGHFERRVSIHGPGVLCIDALYSTDGSLADIEAYLEICERHDCVMVLDEAHSFGMWGGYGGGRAVELGLAERVHFRTLSLSKALGGHGGAVAGGTDMMRSVCTRMRPVLFSSSTSAVLAAGHAAALRLVMYEPERARHCLEMAQLLRDELNRRGVETPGSASQIVSVFLRDEQACRLYAWLRDRGILSSVFVYPAAPMGTSLVRFSVYAELTREDVLRVAEATVKGLRTLDLQEVAT